MFTGSDFQQHFNYRKPLSLLLITILLLICVLYATSHVQADDPGSMDAPTTLSGRVTNQQGQALADINVTVYRMYDGNGSPVRVVSTTVDGSYKALGLSAGTYRVSFVDPKEQYAAFFYRSGATIDDGEDVVVIGLPVTGVNGVLPPSAYITGIINIVDEANATSGEIWVFSQSNGSWSKLKSTTIQSNGAYEIAGLAAGVYRIRANYEELFGFYGGSTIEDATNVTVTASQTISNINIAVGLSQYNGVISGTVTADNKPLTGISVEVDSTEDLFHPFHPTHVHILTNAFGQYGVSGLANGYYIIRFSDPTELYATTYYTTERYPNTLAYLQIRDGTILSDVNVSLVKAGRITGSVHRYNGQPIADVGIRLISTNSFFAINPDIPVTTTDQSGAYTISAILPGVYVLGFSHPLYETEFYGGFTTGGEFPIVSAKSITVHIGETVTNINQTLGPDYVVNLPLLSR